MFRIARGQPKPQGVENANMRDVEYMKYTIGVKEEAPDKTKTSTADQLRLLWATRNRQSAEVVEKGKHVIFKNWREYWNSYIAKMFD